MRKPSWELYVSFIQSRTAIIHHLYTYIEAHVSFLRCTHQVGILYVMDVDEALFRVLGKVAPHWHTRMCQEVDDHFREGFKPGGTNRGKESNSSTEIKQSPNERDQGHTELFSPEHSS